MSSNIQTINVNNNEVKIMRVNNEDYISLTDLARYADNEEPKIPIQNWMRNKDVISFLGLWEKINNNNFKGVEFDTFEKEAGSNKFRISPQKWIKETNAIGIISKSGNNGGTFAHSDIAFEFASWLSPEFKLYLIKEFQRLKKNESMKLKQEWDIRRLISKTNYRIQTDSIKENIVSTLTNNQIHQVYADEADVINVALFGLTAKEWRDNNPELSKDGNIRDYTDIYHLIVLSNLEVLNASMIDNNISQSERLTKLNETARKELSILSNNTNILKIDNKNQMIK